MTIRRLAAAAAVALCVACGSVDSRAGDPPSAESFEKGLAKVVSLHDRGRAQSGLKALDELLTEHARQAYARARRAELVDLARRLSFRATAKVPKPQQVVSGKLKKWDARSGKLQIEYDPKSCADLEQSDGGVWYLPMDLRGPSTIEIRGTQYPKSTDDSPTIYLGGGVSEKKQVEQSYMVVFGTPPYTEGSNEVWMPARILRYDGDDRVVLCEKDISPAKRGRSYKLKLKITSTSLQASINGRSIGKGKKTRDLWGFLGFECKGWRKVIFSGEVEPSWIQSKIDEVLDRQRTAFDASYDPTQVLPAWLLDAQSAEQPSATEEKGFSLPERVAKVHWPRLEKVYEAWDDEQYGRAMDHIAKLREAGGPESVCEYLAALTKSDLGRPAEALTHAERCSKLAPDFAYGHLERGFLLRRLGRIDDCAKAFEEAQRAAPTDRTCYEAAALSMMFAGRLDEAQAAVRRGAKHGVTSPKLELLGLALVKAEKGPTWARTYEHKSANYHVFSDIDKKTCIEASHTLEEMFKAYRVHLGWVSRDRSRLFKVYLFGGRSGFLTYQEDMAVFMGRPTEHAAGLYSPLLKQLLIWNLPNRDEMYATIRHEGFHQYLDRFLVDPPTWFNEGLAVYYEDAERVSGRLEFGQLQREYVEELEEKDLVPLASFLQWSNRRFYDPDDSGYAQAWALIHMLSHGTGRHKALFRQLIAALQAGGPAEEAVAQVLPEKVLDELDRDLERYVAGLCR